MNIFNFNVQLGASIMSSIMRWTLTLFQCWPILQWESAILKLLSGIVKEQTGQLCTTTQIEVAQFVYRHFDTIKRK